MRTLARGLLLSFLALAPLGCGYLASGTWEDDPDNWGRAFHSTKPDDVVLAHSEYSRFPHWSYEFEYFFEIAPNPELRRQLFADNDLVRLEGELARQAKGHPQGPNPPWFARGAVEDYEVWRHADQSWSTFTVLIQKKTGTLFLTDYQM